MEKVHQNDSISFFHDPFCKLYSFLQQVVTSVFFVHYEWLTHQINSLFNHIILF